MKEDISVAYGRNFLNLKFLFDRIVQKKRNEINSYFYSNISVKNEESILDVGTTPSMDSHQNMILNDFPNKSKIHCLSNQDLSCLKNKFLDAKFYLGNGLNINFPDNSFDYVASTATIEHVGSRDNQKKLIQECFRVAKKKVFITTPNRYFPIEFHTRLPFIHFLPQPFHRKILLFFGEKFLSQEENLNLLGNKGIKKILNELKIENYHISYIYTLGIKSNILILINKN